MDALEHLPPDERDEINRMTGVQDFVRKNFGLFHRDDVDWVALRRENQRRHDLFLRAQAGLLPPQQGI